MLRGKKIVLGVTGGIAAYKSADVASKLTQEGCDVKVVMTRAATEFIKPLTFEAVTGNAVITDMFETSAEHRINHIALSEMADIILIAPATADIIAKIACGLADEMLSSTILAARIPVMLSPAMHTAMWENTVTAENIAKLRKRGYYIIEPEQGRLASGGYGAGRFPETIDIIDHVKKVLGAGGVLAGKRILVTAGGTREPIDPVRIISNRSSGKMGYAVAEAARDRGAEVVLITAPTALHRPAGIRIVEIETAAEMKQAVDDEVKNGDALIMAAAVADYQTAAAAADKIKKSEDKLILELVPTPDILGEIKADIIKIGFAAESSNLVENARQKLEKKNLDLIIANNIASNTPVFDADTNEITIISKDGKEEHLPLMSKANAAEQILDRLAGIFRSISA
jgi:phosphopantothenoylcysteine decarboxylase / phosphopantothenate---cysteine ligase